MEENKLLELLGEGNFMVYLGANYCQQCLATKRSIEFAEYEGTQVKRNPNFVFKDFKVNTDEAKPFQEALEVKEIPVIAMVQEGKLLKKNVGEASPAVIKELVEVFAKDK